VGHQGPATGDERRRDRGPHPSVVFRGSGLVEHRLVGQLDRGAEPMAVERRARQEAAGPGDLVTLPRARDERGDHADGEPGRDLARLVPAYPVADTEAAFASEDGV